MSFTWFFVALVLLTLCILFWLHYNDGRKPMLSRGKVITLIMTIFFLAAFILAINIALCKGVKDSILEVFNNLSCTFLGVVIAFFIKRDAFRPKKFDDK